MSSNKSRLREFYNKKQKNSQPSENDQFDKNKASFDSQAYFNLIKLVNKQSLNELMDEEATLMREVKQYDSDMQNLVMENYNKFIMATDTIGRMKVKFQEMESKVLQLSSNIKSINKSAKEIGSCLEPNRKRLNELVNVQQALSQLQFIFSLPKKLENFIDSNEYDQAYELYMESKPVLEKYRNHASFEKTVIHIDILIGKLQTKIFTEKIIPNFKNPKKEDLLKLNDISVHSNQYINLKTTSTEIVAVREILDLVNENLPIAENIAKFNISNGEQVLTSLLDKFETMVIILTNIESIDAVNLTEFCQQFFIRLCEHLEKLDDNIFNVYMIRIVYQRLLDCGDSPNLPPLVNTQELAEKLCISKVRQILSTYDLSLDNNYSNFSGRDLCLNYSMIPGTNLTSQQIYNENRRNKIDNIITNLKDFSDLWSFGKNLPDDPILEMEYFKHGKFYENILETIVINPLRKILNFKISESSNQDAQKASISMLQLSRFAHDLSTSDLDSIADSANKCLEIFTPWNGGVPETILKFKVFCRKQSNLILSNWILKSGDLALNYLDNEEIFENAKNKNSADPNSSSSSSHTNKPIKNISWSEIFKLILQNVEDVSTYYTSNSTKNTSSSGSAYPSQKAQFAHVMKGSHQGRSGMETNTTRTTGSSIHSNDTSLHGNMNRLFVERVEVVPKYFMTNLDEQENSSSASEKLSMQQQLNLIQLPDANLIILTLLKYIIKGAIEVGRLLSHVNLHQTQFDIFCVKDFIRRNFNRKDIFEDNGLKQLLDDWLNSCMVRSEDVSLLEDSALEFLLHRNG